MGARALRVSFSFALGLVLGGCGSGGPPPVGQNQSAVTFDVSSGWSLTGGENGSTCHQSNPGFFDNPSEVFFGQVITPAGTPGFGIATAAAPFACLCCTCTGSQKDFPLGSTLNTNDGWTLQGSYFASRTNAGFTEPSMRVDLILGGTEVAHGSFEDGNDIGRNNNCVPAGETIHPLINNSPFGISLKSFAPGVQFDTVRIVMQGYACQPGLAPGVCGNEDTTNSLDLSGLQLVQPAGCMSNSDCSSGFCQNSTCCDIDCGNLSNASGTCPGGSCQITSCNNGFNDCDHHVANGCESNPQSDAANCGHCGNFCGSGNCFNGSCCSINCNLPHANTTCSTGLCQITSCQDGFADLDGNIFNGCEYNLLCGDGVNIFGVCAGSSFLPDSDGDGIPDLWERLGLDSDCDGVVDLDLPSLGANPNHKDIFVQVDFMQGEQPDPQILTDLRNAFAAAPVTNPDGLSGVNLHIDFANQVPFHNDISLGNFPCGSNDFVNLYDIRSAFFDPKRKDIFHYVVAGSNGHDTACGAVNGLAELYGRAALITFGGPAQAPRASGVLMHELGHNLNLRHGGFEDLPDCKPNYLSVMNRNFVFRGIPFASSFGSLTQAGSRIDYSSATGIVLNEAALAEAQGIGVNTRDITFYACPAAQTTCDLFSQPGAAFGGIDWDCNGNATELFLSADINADGLFSNLTGHDDWHSLKYNFQCNPTNFVDQPVVIPAVSGEPNIDEAKASHRLFPLLDVNIEVRPGCQAGVVAPSDASPVEVAVFSTASFDATQLDPLSVQVSGATPLSIGARDVNGDGLTDLVVQVSMAAMSLTPTSNTVTLRGALPSSQAVFGAASVTVVPKIVIGLSGCPLYRAPTALCHDVTVTADAVSCGGSASIDAGSSDPDAVSLTIDQVPPNPLSGAGPHTVTLDVSNGVFSASCTATVTLIDNTPPSLAVTLTPTSLWPPNHKLVAIAPTFSAHDNCDPAPALALVSVTANEPTQPGDIVAPDAQHIQLAASRLGGGSGRVYTLTFSATDASGNRTTTTGTVTVAHNQ